MHKLLLYKILHLLQVFVLAQSEMEHNFPLENYDLNDDSSSSDNDFPGYTSPPQLTGSFLMMS